MIKVLVVDDIKIFRECLKISLESREDLFVCGCAKDGYEAIEYTKKFKPDIVIIDLNMPNLNGYEAIKKIREKSKNIVIMALSIENDIRKIEKAILNGANLYLSKNTNFENLIMNIYNFFDKRNIVKPKDELYYFTEREKDVLNLVMKGLTNQEISSILGISKGRVNNLITSLLDKTMSKNRVQLAMLRKK